MALSVRPDVLANRHLLSTFPKCRFPKFNMMFIPLKLEATCWVRLALLATFLT